MAALVRGGALQCLLDGSFRRGAGRDTVHVDHLERRQRAAVERGGKGGAAGVGVIWVLMRPSLLSFVSPPVGGGSASDCVSLNHIMWGAARLARRSPLTLSLSLPLPPHRHISFQYYTQSKVYRALRLCLDVRRAIVVAEVSRPVTSEIG